MASGEKFQLTTGENIYIEAISLAHTASRHQFNIELSLAQEGMVHTLDEIDYHTHETEEKIEDFLKNRRGLWLLAFNLHGMVIGEVDINVYKLERVQHNGLLTIGVLPSYQGLGLGSILMEQAMSWAKNHQLKRVELFVFQKNLRARRLYEKFNFIVEGTRKNFLRHQDGTLESDILMARYF